MACLIETKNLDMVNFDTNEVKPYSKIKKDDRHNWVIQDSVALIRDADEVEEVDIEINPEFIP